MEKKNKTKEESKEDECCTNKEACSIDCSPKPKKEESKCGCRGCC